MLLVLMDCALDADDVISQRNFWKKKADSLSDERRKMLSNPAAAAASSSGTRTPPRGRLVRRRRWRLPAGPLTALTHARGGRARIATRRSWRRCDRKTTSSRQQLTPTALPLRSS
jgi:hypothetical protein